MSGKASKAPLRDEAAWQRLDVWLWCARVAKARSDCARLVEAGGVRLNRQPTVKAHARLRIGDVLTIGLRSEVRVWRVAALAARRGPAPEARLLYDEVPEGRGKAGEEERRANSCANSGSAAYEDAQASPWNGDGEAYGQDGPHDAAGEPPGTFPQDGCQER